MGTNVFKEFAGESDMATVVKELLSMDATRFAVLFHAYRECSSEVQALVDELTEIIVDPSINDEEKAHATDAILEALLPSLGTDVREEDAHRMKSDAAEAARAQLDHDEASFVERLRSIMAERKMTQEQLARLTGVSQPAICNMLARRCRPQQRTVARFAEALGVDPSDLWPIQ